MTNELKCQRKYDRPIGNSPTQRSIHSQVHHYSSETKDDDIHAIETLKDAAQTHEKSDFLILFSSSGPLLIHANQIRKQDLGEMKRDAREEEDENRCLS